MTKVGLFQDVHKELADGMIGNRITPSYVAFAENGERLIGMPPFLSYLEPGMWWLN